MITGSTGNTGTSTAEILLDRGYRVRALVRREDARSEALEQAGAEIAKADLLDFRSLSDTMHGVTSAYFCYPIVPGLLEATANFAQAASEAGVRSVVNMSQISARREAASNAARQHWLGERLLDRTTMLTAHLRPTFFAEWIDWFWARRGEQGVLRLPFGDGRHAPIAGRDQAYVIAAILQNPQPHDRQIYPLTGPVEMNHYEIAEAVSRALGIPVTYEPISIEEFRQGLTDKEWQPHVIQHLAAVAQDYQAGIFAGANNLVHVVGNKTPMTVEEYVLFKKDAFAQDGPNAIPDKEETTA
ncbi:NmrA family NAD(P)-binding protein [Streptomyces sp. NPDC057950]|uniref:NmrA family NAD(P)-binding protein n=1 Tax=Streptomyces sp. NPDC057950 TaxID=3346288 RepID=UPI0036E9FAC4